MASDAFYETRLRTELEHVRQDRIESGKFDPTQVNTLSPLGTCLEPRTTSGKQIVDDFTSRNTTGASSNGLSEVDLTEPELINALAFLDPSRDTSNDDAPVAIFRDFSDGTATITESGFVRRDDSASSTKAMPVMMSVQRTDSGKKLQLSFDNGIRYLEVPSPKVDLVEDLAMVDQDYPWLVMGQVPKEKLLAMNVLAIVAEDLNVEVFNAAFAGRCLIRFQVKTKEAAEVLRRYSGFYRFWGGKLVCASSKEEAQMLEQLETAGLREASHCIQFEYAEKKGTAPIPLVPKTAPPPPPQNVPAPNHNHHMSHHHGYHVQGSPPPMYNPRMNQGLPHYAVAGAPLSIGVVSVNYGMGMAPGMMAPPPPPPPQQQQNPTNAGQGRSSSGSSAGTTAPAPSGTTAAPVKSTVALNPAATPFTPGAGAIPPMPVAIEQQPWPNPIRPVDAAGRGKMSGASGHAPAPAHHPKSGGNHQMSAFSQPPGVPEPYFQALPFPSPLPIPKAQPTQPANPGFPAQAKDMKPVQPLPKQAPPEPAPLTSVCGNVFGGGLFGGGFSSLQPAPTYDPFQSPGLIEAQQKATAAASNDRGSAGAIGRPNRNRGRNNQ